MPRMVEAASRASQLLKVLRTIPSAVHEPTPLGECTVRTPLGSYGEYDEVDGVALNGLSAHRNEQSEW